MPKESVANQSQAKTEDTPQLRQNGGKLDESGPNLAKLWPSDAPVMLNSTAVVHFERSSIS